MFDQKWKALIVTSLVVNAVLVIAIALVYLHGNDQIQSVRHNVTTLSSSVSEPPRLSWRLFPLRGLSYATNTQVFTRTA